MGTTSEAAVAQGRQTAVDRATVELAVLGPVEVRRDGRSVDLGPPKQRALVAALALAGGRPMAVDTLTDLLWSGAPPAASLTTLQAYVSGLRKVLEPSRRRRGEASVLVTTGNGYALHTDTSDAVRLQETVGELHPRLALPLLGPVPLAASELRAAVGQIDVVLAAWRGTPYAELADAPDALAERARLEELRAVALEDKAVARLALGEHAAVVAELEALTRAHPLRERLWALLALALVRSGRQADALDALSDVRTRLQDDLGLDPAAELRDLQERILRQDAVLAWSPPGPRADSLPTEVSAAPDERTPLTALADWPMLGRDADLARLVGALEPALAGRTTCAVVTGEPGIGKSRLCSELALRARSRGFRVVVGRCSQDDGAPPLWPWTSVLDQLGADLPSTAASDPGEEFRVRESIARAVRAATAAGPVVVLLDDLHWADTATLRVLRLLVETSSDDPLVVVTTWRDHPRPTGALADVAESLARAHAVRLELGGLDEASVAEVVDAVTDRRPTPAQADALRRRTDGNPFFLIEFARLAGTGVELAELLAEEHPPTAVQEVLTRRLERLPDPSLEALRAASVVGREFDVDLLAATTGSGEDEVLEALEHARAAGLVREDGVDRFAFSHALVRDTVYAGLGPSWRARRHARAAAHLDGRAGRETETARHWLAAGPGQAARAWRSAAVAARVALQAHAHEEAAELLRAALEVMDHDSTARPRDRYDVLMALVTAYRWAARWIDLTPTVEAAIRVGEELGDPVLVAEAAISTTQGALWQSAAHGEVHHEIVAALRRSLAALPAGDSTLRCRCMLSLANELYYGTTYAERRALADEGLAMAHRLDDPSLLVHACHSTYLAVWSPATMAERLDLAERAVDLSRSLGDEQAEVLSMVFRTIALGELGLVARMWESVAEARVAAERLRLVYPLLVLDSMVISWYAMAGEHERCRQILDALLRTVSSASLKHADDAVAGALVAMAIWEGRTQDAVDGVRMVADGPLPVDALLVHLLWRNGQEDEAREHYAAHPPTLDDDDWFSPLNWCNCAAAALYAGDPDLGARAYQRLAPLTGRSCIAGSGNATGPVDGYLALAACATGETALATRHADDAVRLAQEWRIPLFTQWLREQRDRFGF